MHHRLCNLAEDSHIIDHQPARHLRPDLAAAAEWAGQREEGAEALATEEQVDLRRRQLRLGAEEEQLHVQVHLEVKRKEADRKVSPLRLGLLQRDLVHLHVEERDNALHEGLADRQLDVCSRCCRARMQECERAGARQQREDGREAQRTRGARAARRQRLRLRRGQ